MYLKKEKKRKLADLEASANNLGNMTFYSSSVVLFLGLTCTSFNVKFLKSSQVS